jgi:hypothetical protein
MGGFGSGRHEYAKTPTVGQSTALSISWVDEFTESPGLGGKIWWGESEEEADRLMFVSSEGESATADGRPSRLRFRYQTEDADSGDVLDEYDYRVPLDYTECHFGGYRPWFRCPDCGSRVAKLYLPPGCYRLACRECYELGYYTSRTSGDDVKQAELRFKRAFAKADKDNRRPHPGGLTGVPKRPKGTHRDTFKELEANVWAAHDEWSQACDERMRELLQRADG